MTMFPHVHSQAKELHSFRAQTHTLFEAAFTGKENLSICADDAVPRKTAGRSVQSPCDLTGCAGISGSVRDVAVGRDFATRNATHLREEVGEH